MLKDKITELCQLNNVTIKKLSIDLNYSEPTFYRWFKADSMELKHLRKIAEYFNKELAYFFSNSVTITTPQSRPSNLLSQQVNERAHSYGVQEKYIKALERITELQEENKGLKEKLTWYEMNCDCSKTKQNGQKRA
jgi:hypothetical protein